MKKIFILIIIAVMTSSGIGQNNSMTIRYYKDRYQQDEVNEKKAIYKRVTTVDDNNVKKIRYYLMSPEQPVWEQEYTDDEPTGIWRTYDDKGNLTSERDFDELQSLYGVLTDTNVVAAELLDEPASFLNGESAMMQFIQENISYPQEAVENGIQGIVYVKLKIDEKGNVIEISIARGVDAFLDYEAYRVVKASKGKWKPATNKKGKPVTSYFMLPIHFRLG